MLTPINKKDILKLVAGAVVSMEVTTIVEEVGKNIVGKNPSLPIKIGAGIAAYVATGIISDYMCAYMEKEIDKAAA